MYNNISYYNDHIIYGECLLNIVLSEIAFNHVRQCTNPRCIEHIATSMNVSDHISQLIYLCTIIFICLIINSYIIICELTQIKLNFLNMRNTTNAYVSIGYHCKYGIIYRITIIFIINVYLLRCYETSNN